MSLIRGASPPVLAAPKTTSSRTSRGRCPREPGVGLRDRGRRGSGRRLALHYEQMPGGILRARCGILPMKPCITSKCWRYSARRWAFCPKRTSARFCCAASTASLDIPSSDVDVALIMLARATGASLTIPSEGIANQRSKVLRGSIYCMLKATNLTASGVITVTLDDTEVQSRSVTAGTTGKR